MLDSTKYPNNVRTVSGTPQLYKDDVVLLCDTSVGPVVINLLEIPDQFSTLWKLYIIDVSGNASTNNITINAGGTQTVNGTPSLPINVDNGSAIVRISNTGIFNAGLSYTTIAPGTGHIISNDGTPLTQQPILNFVGDGVTATNGSGETIITIPGGGSGLIPITEEGLSTLINTDTLIPGAFYQITDPSRDPKLKDYIIQATSLNTTSSYGAGNYWVCDYQGNGTYTGSGLTGNTLGLWSGDLTPVPVPLIGDACIYNNLHYVNLTGSYGDEPGSDANWEELPLDITNGYICEQNFVLFQGVGFVIRRSDQRGNVVDFSLAGKGGDSFDSFGWGNNNIRFNECLKDSQYINRNTGNIHIYNTVTNDSQISDFTPRQNEDQGRIYSNNVRNQGNLQIVGKCLGDVQENDLDSNSTVSFTNSGTFLQGSQFNGNKASNGCFIRFGNSGGTIDQTTFNFNQFDSGSSLSIDNAGSRNSFNSNVLSNDTDITIETMQQSINECNFENAIIDRLTLDNSQFQVSVGPGFSNWTETLDMTDQNIFASPVLTIPVLMLQYVGIFLCQNTGPVGNVFDTIINHPKKFPFRIEPFGVGITIEPVPTPVATATNFQIIADEQTNVGTKVLTGRSPYGSDYAVFKNDGTPSGIILMVEKRVWQ
jgi:hypothetical protein